jgi:hypothetical protein
VGDLADVDPVAITRAWLLTRPQVTSRLGNPTQIGAYNQPPYPCVRLTDPPGDDRTLQHLIAPLVQIEVYGDIDGTPGKPALRALLYRVLAEMKQLPDQATEPGDPVVTSIGSSGGGGWSPEPTGQPRYIATVRMHVHPPVDATQA